MRRILVVLTVGSMMAIALLMAATPGMAEIDGDVGDDIGIDGDVGDDGGIDKGLFGSDGLFGGEGPLGDDEDDEDDDE